MYKRQSFAFDEVVPVVDGNVFRVLSRLFALEIDIASSGAQKYFFELGKKIISKNMPATYNQAIMEFGSLQCTPTNPKCNICPLNESCMAFLKKTVHLYPIKNKKIKIKKRYFNYAILVFEDKLVMNERKGKDIWQGLYEFPLYESKKENCTEEELLSWLVSTYKLKFDDFTLKNVSKTHKHILSHQHIYTTFFSVYIKKTAFHNEFLNNSYTLEQTFELPKPILVDNYLKESIF